MGLSSALYTGLSGLNANSTTITVAGNNIANSNTTAFKSGRTDFETQITQTLKHGSAPSAELGGSNPAAVGLGVRLAGISTDFTDGSIQPTGRNTDIAIEGGGFFIVSEGGDQTFTRAGKFDLDRNANLVTAGGGLLQGYGVDDEFNLIEGPLGELTVPLNRMTIAAGTGTVHMAGNLNADGDIATAGSIQQSQPLFADALASVAASATTALTSLFNDAGNQLFQSGDVVTLTGVTKGSAVLPDRTFEVGAANTTDSHANGSTLQDFMSFMEEAMGIDTSVNGGVSINGGVMAIESNAGTRNALNLSSSEAITNLGGSSPEAPFAFQQTQEANGESVRTSFVAYDSLGSELLVDVTMSLEAKSNGGTTWRFFAESADDSDLGRQLGTGTLEFDINGRYVGASNTSIMVDRDATGAFTPQTVDLVFDDPGQPMSALADSNSQITTVFQDGYGIGTLVDFSVEENGTITGVFSNSQLRTLGKVVLADFVNPGGLEQVAGSSYRVTAASGSPTLIEGKVIGKALELSNVDLSNEFINLINASTGYSASSRVVSTSDRLLQELLQQV